MEYPASHWLQLLIDSVHRLPIQAEKTPPLGCGSFEKVRNQHWLTFLGVCTYSEYMKKKKIWLCLLGGVWVWKIDPSIENSAYGRHWHWHCADSSSDTNKSIYIYIYLFFVSGVRCQLSADMENVTTIATSGSVNFFRTGVNILLLTYAVLS